VGQTVRALGADGLRAFEVYLISEVFSKVFREKSLSGGKSEINLEHTIWCAARVDGVDGPRSSRGRSARLWRTIRGVLADSPPEPTGTSDNS
jgi:hypothetical protein